jgi:hypothetical protein
MQVNLQRVNLISEYGFMIYIYFKVVYGLTADAL